MKKLILASLTLCLFVSLSFSQRKPQADSCTIPSEANDRRKVKNRILAQGENYQKFKNGRAITVSEFYDLVCGFAD